MKIALYGNVANNLYNISKALRKHTTIEPHLFLLQDRHSFTKPESDDPELEGNYPSWIHFEKRWDAAHFFKTLTIDRSFVRELNKYDAVIVSDIGGALAPYLKKKVFFWTTGADVTRMPFPHQFPHLFPTRASKIKAALIGYLQRRGLKYVHQFWTQPFKPFLHALNKLGIPKHKISTAYFPLIIDEQIMQPIPNAINLLPASLKSELERFKFTIFSPSRIMIFNNPRIIEAGQWKGNDCLFYGFARFIEKYKVKDAAIVMPDTVLSPDMQTAKDIIKKLGIENNVIWLKPVTGDAFNRREMALLYSATSMTADDFSIGWFGSIVVEAAACGRPVLNYIDEEAMKELYPWHPLISQKSPDGIADAIAKIYFDPEYATRKGLESKKWALEFHSSANASKKYVKEIQRLLETSV